jgi:hypothetical protein
MLNLPWDESPVEVRLAAVKWMKDNHVGVEFLKVGDDDRVSLDVFLASRSKIQESHARVTRRLVRPLHRSTSI